MKITKRPAAAMALISLALLTSACSPPAQGSSAEASAAGADQKLSVGFFGFAKSNGFAQGTYLGVEQAAKANNASATFVDSNFSAQTQVQQIQDAVTSKQFEVIVVQANDNQALIAPLTQAVQAGITVVVEFSVIGPKFDTIQPQVPGAISIVDLPTRNGKVLGEMGKEACATVQGDTCKVAYLEGFKSLPLDNARTEAVKAELATDPKIKLVASVEGGYTQDSGRQAFQNVSQANPDVDVMIGASQAITGAAAAAGNSDIKFIGNGASVSNVEAVRSGKWFSIYVSDVVANGAKATELGLAKARGKQVETAIDEASLSPNNGKGTKEALDSLNYVSKYSD
ncbi:sugar ABC transporter substrate-binding protein [Arthrobacter sp. NPDC057013]|uniref:sugar ABC transporter substrate-binding protein n=1 Tax=Arthrobacter sp. NPDC057013 TaxID=3345999 RepID=UPI003631F158